MRILLVEDDPVLQAVMLRSLADAGHRVAQDHQPDRDPAEQVEPVDGDADIATKPAATTTRTVAVRTESVPSEPDSEQEAVAAPIATAVDAVAVGARQPSLLTVVGSLVMNLLMGLIHLVDGAPVVPPGSTVTVRTSSLTLPVGKGEEVQFAIGRMAPVTCRNAGEVTGQFDRATRAEVELAEFGDLDPRKCGPENDTQRRSPHRFFGTRRERLRNV